MGGYFAFTSYKTSYADIKTARTNIIKRTTKVHANTQFLKI
jgi:hypothetical protein